MSAKTITQQQHLHSNLYVRHLPHWEDVGHRQGKTKKKLDYSHVFYQNMTNTTERNQNLTKKIKELKINFNERKS